MFFSKATMALLTATAAVGVLLAVIYVIIAPQTVAQQEASALDFVGPYELAQLRGPLPKRYALHVSKGEKRVLISHVADFAELLIDTDLDVYLERIDKDTVTLVTREE